MGTARRSLELRPMSGTTSLPTSWAPERLRRQQQPRTSCFVLAAACSFRYPSTFSATSGTASRESRPIRRFTPRTSRSVLESNSERFPFAGSTRAENPSRGRILCATSVLLLFSFHVDERDRLQLIVLNFDRLGVVVGGDPGGDGQLAFPFSVGPDMDLDQ